MEPMQEEPISKTGMPRLLVRWGLVILVGISLSCSGHGGKPPWEARTDLPDQAPNIYGKTVQQVAADTGYTVEEIQKYFPPIQEWGKYGVEPPPDRIADSFARQRFAPPPKPYVHPRIFFNPEDVPEIRRRLKETRVGRRMIEDVRRRLLQLAPTPDKWDESTRTELFPHQFLSRVAVADESTRAELLAKVPEEEAFSLAARANRQLAALPEWAGSRALLHDGWVGGLLNRLDEEGGSITKDEGFAYRYEHGGRVYMGPRPELWGGGPGAGSELHQLMLLLPYEALRCLVDEDDKGGRRVARGLASIAAMYQLVQDWYDSLGHSTSLGRYKNWQIDCLSTCGPSLGITYDLAYKWMSRGQRTVVRKIIAVLTRGQTYRGLDYLPAFPANTSRWQTIHADLLPMVLAIEGEEGYDPAVYFRLVESLRKWVYVAHGPDGAPFGGLVWHAYAPQWLIPLAKRGEPFIGTEWARNYVSKYLLHTMLPWGGVHVFDSGIGCPQDTWEFKYAHPEDPGADIVYAGSVRSCLEGAGARTWLDGPAGPFPADLWCLFVCDDPLGSQGGEYSVDEAYSKAMAYLGEHEPLTYFSDYRGLMATRSGWSPDALYLYFEPHHIPGGVRPGCVNDFVIAAQGRVWATRTSDLTQDWAGHSVILPDGGTGRRMAGEDAQGRTVAFEDATLATFAAANAAWAYSCQIFPVFDGRGVHGLWAERQALSERLDVLSRAEWRGGPICATPNDSRLQHSPLPWMAQPWSFLPAWHTSMKGGRHGRWDFSGIWLPYAYRTVGLVRGRHTYAMIVDDYQQGGGPGGDLRFREAGSMREYVRRYSKDFGEHTYTWQMQLPADVELVDKAAGQIGKDQVVDLVLGDQEGRSLLVRVLQAGSEAAEAGLTQSDSKVVVQEEEVRGGGPVRPRRAKLELPLKAVTGAYKVMLYPHRVGDALPETSWADEGGTLQVTWPDQRDEYSFSVGPDGRTRLTLKRDGEKVLELAGVVDEWPGHGWYFLF